MTVTQRFLETENKAAEGEHMARDQLAKTYLYHGGEWTDLHRDTTFEDYIGGELPMWTEEWYEALGYDPRAHVFGLPLGVSVEVYKQDDDSDAAPHTFM